MTINKSKRALNISNAVLIFIVLLFHGTNTFDFTVLGAVPMIPLALLVAISIFTNELSASLLGLLFGAVCDSVSTGGSFYHTVIFFCLALAVSFTAHYLFNNNIRSALLLCFLSGCIYYFFRWLLYYAFTNPIEGRLPYLLSVGLPSVIYTTIFVIPFYYLEKFLFNKYRK